MASQRSSSAPSDCRLFKGDERLHVRIPTLRFSLTGFRRVPADQKTSEKDQPRHLRRLAAPQLYHSANDLSITVLVDSAADNAIVDYECLPDPPTALNDAKKNLAASLSHAGTQSLQNIFAPMWNSFLWRNKFFPEPNRSALQIFAAAVAECDGDANACRLYL
jgi:hypothetical protein